METGMCLCVKKYTHHSLNATIITVSTTSRTHYHVTYLVSHEQRRQTHNTPNQENNQTRSTVSLHKYKLVNVDHAHADHICMLPHRDELIYHQLTQCSATDS